MTQYFITLELSGSSETRFEVEDTCSGAKGTGRVEIDFDTRDVDVLPIKDFRAYDFGEKVIFQILISFIDPRIFILHNNIWNFL